MTHSIGELDKYIKTVIPNDLSRLDDHTDKLARYSAENQKGLFAEEETEARGTLRHLKSNLKILNNAISGLPARERREAEKRMSPLRDKIQIVVHKFQVLCPAPEFLHVEPLTASSSETDLMIEPESFGENSNWQRVTMSPLLAPNSLTPEQRSSLESAEALQADLSEIQTLFNELVQLATVQQRPILRLEEHTERAETNLDTARNELNYASRLKAAAFPVTGALIGGLIGGPLGALAGLKGAALVGMGGLSIGAAAGWGIKKIHRWNTDRLHEKDD